MKAKDLRERSTEDLRTLVRTLRQDLFSYRMKNATSRLDDTSLLVKTRKDIARIEHLLGERAGGEAKSDGGTES
jgi:large subunit ribosomal protein L29